MLIHVCCIASRALADRERIDGGLTPSAGGLNSLDRAPDGARGRLRDTLDRQNDVAHVDRGTCCPKTPAGRHEACRPAAESHQVEPAISRVLSRIIIHLDAVSPRRSSNLPGDSADHTIVPLFGLAPGGVYLAVECCHRRGALLPHPFTLTVECRNEFRHSLRRSALCCTSRRLAPPRRYLAPCPVEPGLSSVTLRARACRITAMTWPTPPAGYQSRPCNSSVRA